MSEKAVAPTVPAESPARRRDPFAGVARLKAEIDRLWNDPGLFGSFPRILEFSAWSPRADVFEQNGSLVVKAELPGVPKEQIEVTVDGGNLVIRGERRAEEEVKEEDFYRLERNVGSFYRRLPLPEGVKEEDISASFADGVLEVRMPKPPAAPAPNKIAIT